MRTKDQVGAVERTVTAPAEHPAAARRAEEFTASRRGRFRTFFYTHPRVMDLVVVICYFMTGLSAVVVDTQEDWRVVAHLIIFLLMGATLFWRRKAPITVLAIISCLEVVNVFAVPSASNIGGGIWFALYAVAVSHRGRVSFSLMVAASLPLIIYTLSFYKFPEALAGQGSAGYANNIIIAIMIALSNLVATGIGASVRRNRLYEAELHKWAISNAQFASVAERNRIAREMHDVVAHSLTVMVALSDGAAVVVKRDPDKAGEVLGQLSQTGRNALADMRRVLGVLREESTTSERAPQASQAELTALFEGFRQAGMPLTVTQTGPPLPADPTFQLAIYRIAQESLTNVLRYGTSVSRVRVLIDNHRRSDTVRLQIADDGHGSVVPSKGTGRGIAGMQERARIYSGTVTAGPMPNGGWSVEAILHPTPESIPTEGSRQ